MQHEKQNRCLHIDWLEVYVLEPLDRYPMNAEYFRQKGYVVNEREYGTRVYNEMFELLNENGDPIVEVRRNPASGDSTFSGLVPQSCHLRLPNWMLYQGNPVTFLMDFMLKNDYIFKRIFRIDLALDFEYFDSGDRPAAFVRRYLEGKFRKINQCNLTAHGEDTWNNCNWNSLSWGSRTSMVSTKLYNKTKELTEGKSQKPYIRTCWMMAGLVDNPMSMTRRKDDGSMESVEIWRLEFSLKSACDGYIVYKIEKGKKTVSQRIPHRLTLFDTDEKLWQRFQDLTYHYFRFKHKEFVGNNAGVSAIALGQVHSDRERPLRRKDRCRDKKLFYFDADHQFAKLTNAPTDSKANRTDDMLERRLRMYQMKHPNPDIKKACQIILDHIELSKLANYSPKHHMREAKALQTLLRWKMNGDSRDPAVILEEITRLLNEDNIY